MIGTNATRRDEDNCPLNLAVGKCVPSSKILIIEHSLLSASFLHV